MKPNSYTSWILRRLLTGYSLSGEVTLVSDSFKAIASHLANQSPDDRNRDWEAYLCGQVDRDQIVLSLADADPLGPEPEGDNLDDGWPPLRLGGLPPVDPFPIDVLPEVAASLVKEGASAIGCPPDFLGVPILAVVGGTIGRSVSLMLKDGYFASSTIFAACVGPPSDGKTPALKAVAVAVRKIDETLEAEYNLAMERWKAESEKKNPNGEKIKPPPKPKPRRIDLDDITMEALPLVLADNPRGLVMIRDELTAFVLGMNQFKGGKGNDRFNALKIWSGDAIKKDRVLHENNVPIRCSHPSLSIVGGLPPDLLRELLDPRGRSDGFLDRFLLAFPDPLPVAPWTDRGIPDEIVCEWHALLSRLWLRPLNVKEGKSVPHVARFTTEAKATWERLYDAHKDEMNAGDFPPALRGPWGKFREYAGRLILVLTLMDHAANLSADHLAVPNVNARHVTNAWGLVSYFKSHARRVQAAIHLGSDIGGGQVVKAIIEWIRSGSRLSFSERDLKQARRWIEPDKLADALAYLTQRNAIRPRESPAEKPRVGHPPSRSYEVNPALLNAQNTRNTQKGSSNRTAEPSFEGSEYFEKPVRGLS